MENFRKVIKRRVLVMDGAMGTMLQSMGMKPGGCPEELNLSKPELIQKIHRMYIKAGAMILDTNTFGANRIKLQDFGLEKSVYDINFAGIKNAKKASQGNAYVAGSIGPTGKFIEPVGDLSFEEAVDVFREQARAIISAGADLIAIETMMDIREFKAAIIAVRECADIPILAMMTFNEDLRTVLGTHGEVTAVVAEGLGVDVVGANCSVGPEKLFEVIKNMSRVTSLPLIMQANAGVPELKNGVTCYPATPEDMAGYVADAVAVGARIIGGCCGTTPDHVKAIAEAVKRLPFKPELKKNMKVFKVASRTKSIIHTLNSIPLIVGERINPTGKERFTKELREGNTLYIREEAQRQSQHGAGILDINVSAAMVDEKSMMKRALFAVNTVCDTSVMIDSPNPDVIEVGLMAVDGKPIVNSITGEKKKMSAILPLVKKYGSCVIGLTIDEKGIPDSAKARIKIAEKIIKTAEDYGIRRESIIIDALTLAVGAQKGRPEETLNTIKTLHDMGVFTILGVSNISFGMPARHYLNSAFLAMAILSGLDFAIINPMDENTVGIFYASALLAGRDSGSQFYVSKYSQGQERVIKKSIGADTIEQIRLAIINGQEENIVNLIEQALREGRTPVEISQSAIVSALEVVGKDFGAGKIFLPQVMVSAEVVKKGFERLKQELKTEKRQKIARIIFATVEGDVHDIGKNIVIAMLENFGFEIIDLGKNVPSKKIIDVAKETKPDVIALSALMTTTMVKMKEVIDLLEKHGMKIKVAVGGAAVTEEFAQRIGAAIYAKDAVTAVEKFRQCFAKNVVK
jgi:5-methyltetrahydrofolate--homocysteine methyltransferase